MTKRRLVGLCLALSCLGAQGAIDIPLRLEERGGVQRSAWPVRGGVPFARGVVAPGMQIGLIDPSGRPVDLQATTLCRWPDGSAKWLLLDFSADLPANGSAIYRLVPGGAATPPARTNLATETAEGAIVDTGPIRLVAHRKGRSLFSVWQDRDGDGRYADEELVTRSAADAFVRLQSVPSGPPDRENWLRDAADDPGVLFSAARDEERAIVVEENGPRHAVVRIDGWHVSPEGRRAFRFTLRIHAFRGIGRLSFQHTFVATEDVEKNFLREMSVVFPFEGRRVQATVGMREGAESRQLEPGEALTVSAVGDPRLYHLVSFRQAKRVTATAEVRSSNVWAALSRDIDPPGWAVLGHDRGGLAVAFRDFRNLHPKELRVEGDGRLVVYLWPDRGGKCLDLRRRSQTLDEGYLENGMDPNAGRGIARTHEWVVDLFAGTPSAEAARQLAKAVNEPVFPYVTPEYYAATGAFGEFLAYDPVTFPRIEAAIAFGFRYMREVRRAFGMDGMIDWGDIGIAGVGQADHKGAKDPEGIPWRGYTGWCNSDFALAHGFFLHYLRTGDRQVLLDGEAMTEHVMDIDMEHYSPEDPKLIGRGHRHDQQHWGNGLRDYCFVPNETIDLYLLTGNRRAYDVARETADGFVTNGGGFGRYMTLRFWEISGEEKYRRHAEEQLREDLDLAHGGRQGWPFMWEANFRTKSYDGIGYTFYDSILPGAELSKAFPQAMDALRERYLSCWQGKGHPDHCLFALGHKYAPTPGNTEMLKIAVWLAAAGFPSNAATFALPADAPFEKLVAVNAKTIRLGRTDVFGLYYLVGLPRVLARLKAVGVPESDAVDYRWTWHDAPSFTESIEKKKVTPMGKSWGYMTKHESPSKQPEDRMPVDIQRRTVAAMRRHVLYEDDRELGPFPYSAAAMIQEGRKGWARRLSGAIQFTTPDNSDPRTNGRTYKLVYVSEADARDGSRTNLVQGSDAAAKRAP